MDGSQPRDPDGKFAEKPLRIEAVRVRDNSSATFSFPPQFTTAEEHLNFFFTAPISERVLSNAIFAHRELRHQQAEEKAEWEARWFLERRRTRAPLSANYEDDSRHRRYKKESLGNDQVYWELLLADERKKAWQELPQAEIPERDVEQVMRAGWAWRKSGGLSDAELSIIDSTQVELSNATMTIKEIVEHFSTGRWIDDAVTDTDLRVAKGQEKLYELLLRRGGGL